MFPATSFSIYSMHDDFARYLKTLEAIVVAYNTNEVYNSNQLELMLMRDGNDLLGDPLPNEDN